MNPGGIMSDVTIPEAVQAQADAISQELVDHAFKHGKLVNAYLPEFIARAILAERERCQMALVNASNNPPDRWAWRSSDREALDWGWTKGLQFGAAVIRAASGEST